MILQTFYVDLDLTSTNIHKRPVLKKTAVDNDIDGEEAAEAPGSPTDEPSQQLPPENTNGPPHSPAGEVQILALPSQNPVVLYQNQAYYCTWSDMIGTAVYFSGPEERFDNPLHQSGGYQIVNTSRIKLIGQKVRASRNKGWKRKRPIQDNTDKVEGDEAPKGRESQYQSLGDFRTTNPHTNSELRKQATFLERMMDVKQARGESDNVRTTWTKRTGNTRPTRPKAAPGGHQTTARDQEIEELNRRVVRGDGDALSRLQDIYSNLDEFPSTPREVEAVESSSNDT